MLAENITHFTRVLRRAGLPVGPDRALQAIAAVEAVGVDRREDVHAALSAVMLDRHEQQPTFDAAFDTFWRDPKRLGQLMAAMLPSIDGGDAKERAARANRLAEALAPTRPDAPPPRASDGPDDEIRLDAAMTSSDRERLQRADFETMTTAEFDLAKRIAERAPLPVVPVRQRRHEAADRGRIDLRRSLQCMARRPDLLEPAFTRARVEWPPIVVLLDISGSMERYSRMFLHYVHGLARRLPSRVHAFTFGTRLTDITRCMRHRDPDEALALADARVADWRGGTRIAASLDEFNHRWARRVLGANAAVLLVTDGLERGEHDDVERLDRAIAMLHRSAHRVVWLNPLLRYAGFEPRAAGVRTMLAHVDRFLPVHNLASLADLGRALHAPAQNPAALLARTRPSASKPRGGADATPLSALSPHPSHPSRRPPGVSRAP
jgi:hypothetical protein